jgi:hypothetical protein
MRARPPVVPGLSVAAVVCSLTIFGQRVVAQAPCSADCGPERSEVGNLHLKRKPPKLVGPPPAPLPCSKEDVGCVVPELLAESKAECFVGPRPRHVWFSTQVHIRTSWPGSLPDPAPCSKGCSSSSPCRNFSFCMLAAHECGHVDTQEEKLRELYRDYMKALFKIPCDCDWETKEIQTFSAFLTEATEMLKTEGTENEACKAGCDYHKKNCR